MKQNFYKNEGCLVHPDTSKYHEYQAYDGSMHRCPIGNNMPHYFASTCACNPTPAKYNGIMTWTHYDPE